MISRPQITEYIVNDAIIKDIYDAVNDINYGTITITVHNRKITQIEIAQKKRFDDVWREGGGRI